MKTVFPSIEFTFNEEWNFIRLWSSFERCYVTFEQVTRAVGKRSSQVFSIPTHEPVLLFPVKKSIFFIGTVKSRGRSLSTVISFLGSPVPPSLLYPSLSSPSLSFSLSKRSVHEPRESPVWFPFCSFHRYISNWRARPLISFYRRMGFEVSGAVMRFKCKTG